MRHLRFCTLLLILSLFPVALPAQQSTTASPTVSDPQAVALVQKALAALIGGMPITDVTLTGTARRIAGSDDETGTATLKATALGDSRVDLTIPSGNLSEIRNHSALPLASSLPQGTPTTVAQGPQPVGAWSGPDGVLHGIALHNVLAVPAWYFPHLTLARLLNPPYVLSYVGVEPFGAEQAIHIAAAQRIAPAINGQPATELPAPIQHLSQLDLYLDTVTLLPLAVAYAEHPDTNFLVDIPIRVEFSGYQASSNTQVPRHVRKFLNNGLVLDLQVNSVSMNSGVAAATFQIQ